MKNEKENNRSVRNHLKVNFIKVLIYWTGSVTMKSMTGYGQSVVENDEVKIKVEARSYNHRFREISIRMPKQLLQLEEQIKKVVQNYINRGKVDVFISIEGNGIVKKHLQIDWDLLNEYLKAGQMIAKKTNVNDDLTLKELLFHEQLVILEEEVQEDEHFTKLLIEAVNDAINELTNMRIKEGEALRFDLQKRLTLIKELVAKIEQFAPHVVEHYREKLRKRVQEFLHGTMNIDENRLLTEVAIFAEKSNIDEEITRLKSHVEQFFQTMDDGIVCGRKLDFIAQEMNREANTIGSKANDVKISRYVVELKSEIEKIKEQVQNVE